MTKSAAPTTAETVVAVKKAAAKGRAKAAAKTAAAKPAPTVSLSERHAIAEENAKAKPAATTTPRKANGQIAAKPKPAAKPTASEQVKAIMAADLATNKAAKAAAKTAAKPAAKKPAAKTAAKKPAAQSHGADRRFDSKPASGRVVYSPEIREAVKLAIEARGTRNGAPGAKQHVIVRAAVTKAQGDLTTASVLKAAGVKSQKALREIAIGASDKESLKVLRPLAKSCEDQFCAGRNLASMLVAIIEQNSAR